jgi:hypothetical protein
MGLKRIIQPYTADRVSRQAEIRVYPVLKRGSKEWLCLTGKRKRDQIFSNSLTLLGLQGKSLNLFGA